MIDLVFSNSAECTLRYAQSWEQSAAQLSGGFAVDQDNEQPSKFQCRILKWQNRRREKKKWKQSAALSRDDRNIYALYLGLSMGDISADAFWCQREKFLCDSSLDQAEDAIEFACTHLKKMQSDLDQICTRLKEGEALRIWYSNSGEERCMLAWFAAQIQKHGLTTAEIYLNELPEKYPLPGGGEVSWTGWGEVEPSQWSVLHREICRSALDDFLSEQTALWQKLQEENTGLRIWKDGAVQSVPETYYDAMIRAEIAGEPEEFREAHLIGRLMGKGLLMPDIWIAGRIEKMIAAGELAITWEETPGSRSYRRRLKKV